MKFVFYVTVGETGDMQALEIGNPPRIADCLKSIKYTSQIDIATDSKSLENVWALYVNWHQTKGSND